MLGDIVVLNAKLAPSTPVLVAPTKSPPRVALLIPVTPDVSIANVFVYCVAAAAVVR